MGKRPFTHMYQSDIKGSRDKGHQLCKGICSGPGTQGKPYCIPRNAMGCTPEIHNLRPRVLLRAGNLKG